MVSDNRTDTLYLFIGWLEEPFIVSSNKENS